jgi:hypothetical protein
MKNLVKGFVSYSADYTENLFYEYEGKVFGCFNLQHSTSMWKGKTYIECERPEHWEYIGMYNLNESSK